MTRFADTTALFEYYAGTQSTRSEARRVLRPRDDVASSDHVEREWKRIIFKTVRDFLDAVETEPDLSAICARMSFGFGREGSQRWRVASLLCGGSDSLSVTDIRIRGRQLLRGNGSRLFRRCIGDLRTESRCGLARQEPFVGSDGEWQMKITCQRGEGICDQEDRIGRDLARWKAGADALAASTDSRLHNMGKTAQAMAENAKIRTGKNTYERTGDLAIALDCRADELLVTTDHSFSVLASAMGYRVHHIEAASASS